MNNRCTIVVSSCDKYEDTWYPFFRIMKAQWPDRPYPIVLNTESKTFDYEDMNIKTFRFYGAEKKVPWGKRLIKTLKAIDTEYVIFLLDDFFFLEPVDQERIEQCIKWMDNDHEIAAFTFNNVYKPNISDGIYPHFERRPQDGIYRLNCQGAVWRREKLISFIRPHESPWEWEVLGSLRSTRYKEKFYSAIDGEPKVMTYIKGGGLWGGKWVNEVIPLFEKYDIKIDLSVRGFFTNNSDNPVSHRSLINRVANRAKRELVKWKSLR